MINLYILSVYRYQNQYDGQNTDLSLVKKGRKPCLSESGKRKFYESITNDAMTLQGNTVGEGGSGENLFAEIMKEERSNQYCQKTFCKRTYRNYVKSLNLKEHDATSKNTGRISAFTNIRNHLTLCTMLDNLQEFVQGENLHSVDDVSILANPMSRKSKVLLSKAERFLQEPFSILESSQ